MLWALNMFNYVLSGNTSPESVQYKIVTDNVIHMLDTDDLIVQDISLGELIKLVGNDTILVENMFMGVTRNILTRDELDLTFRHTYLGSKDNKIQWHKGNDKLEAKALFVINGTKKILGIALDGASGNDYVYNVFIQGAVVHYFKVMKPLEKGRSGVAYFYRLNDYIIVRYVVYYLGIFHPITFVFTVAGEDVGVFTNDDVIGKFTYGMYDKAFYGKLVTIYGGRY